MQRITQVFENALGTRPSEFSKGGDLGQREIDALRAWYLEWQSGPEDLTHPSNEIWPLISHHDDVADNVVLRNFIVRSEGNPDVVKPKKQPINELMMHLVACNGVVVADPLKRIFFDVHGNPVSTPRSADILRVAERIGKIEELIDRSVIQVSRIHPLLQSRERQQWIEPFNLGPDLENLVDLVQEGHWLPSLTRHEQDFYQQKVAYVLQSCGIRPKDLPQGLDALSALTLFARALIEVSWQLANVLRSGADLYLTSPLERRVFEVLFEWCTDTLSQYQQITDTPDKEGRHLEMLATVGLPLLDTKAITYTDLLDIRGGAAFRSWRETMNGALDTYAAALEIKGHRNATAVFKTKMSLAADELNRGARDKSFRKAFTRGNANLVISSAATTTTQLMIGSANLATVVGIGALGVTATKLCEYVLNRQRTDQKAAVRFIAAFDL